jgi:hypothetical protein
MSRNEIGNYLGLAVETVSRVFTRFQQNELIAAEGKEIHILDPIQLCAPPAARSKADLDPRLSEAFQPRVYCAVCSPARTPRRWSSTPSTSNP